MTALADARARQAFFDAVRAQPFGGSLRQGQVSGIGSLLDACPPDLGTEALAYCLATAFHETARTMLPVKEYGGAAYYQRMYDITGERPAKARELGNVNPGDGVAFAGRGYVQLTGRSNYRRATQRLRALGMIPALTDLETVPDFALDPDIAAAILFVGTREGWFTGKKLSDYLGNGKADWTGARRIINGQDRAGEIALHAQAFATALRKAGYAPGAAVTRIPTPPVQTAPILPVFAPAPRNGGSPATSEPPALAAEPGGLIAFLRRTFGPYKKAS